MPSSKKHRPFSLKHPTDAILTKRNTIQVMYKSSNNAYIYLLTLFLSMPIAHVKYTDKKGLIALYLYIEVYRSMKPLSKYK